MLWIIFVITKHLNISDEVKHLMIQMHDGKVYVKMIAMATLSTDTEVQYNSAGTLGQLALICKYIYN